MATVEIGPNHVVTWLSLLVSLIAMLCSGFYLFRFVYLSRGQSNGVLRKTLEARRSMFIYIFVLMTLLFVSDICSIYVNMNSNGVSVVSPLINRVGQLAMAFQLVAMALHVSNWASGYSMTISMLMRISV
ncbi:hypothetical protein HK097_002653 [Rhizophlyctis rosea]|uniref:Uncharacterized protein n=1 Tax=Rhizophlyctis rosea TaxID=64517 RepID=A0AAD5S376_9FUNG|nr:hypothetical protein HK097_002653 [Rhizophlyctis rosea]